MEIHECKNRILGDIVNISVFGLGYVGCVSAACLASFGHQVVGVDINYEKVESINNGHSPIIERGLDELIKSGKRNGNLSATQETQYAVIHGEVLLICVGTPSDPNGNLNYIYIDRVCNAIGQSLRDASGYKLIVIRSTTLPGTIHQRIIPILTSVSGKQAGEDFSVTSNPEFLREGSAIDDFNHPPFTLIGATEKLAGDMLEQLYQNIPAPVYRTDPDTACMVKYASNAFHGLKVAFSNEIGQLCKKSGVDGMRVMEIFCSDTLLNISPRYLKPGFAFGGSCLPKDLRALNYLAKHSDLELPVLEAILSSNRLLIQNVANLIINNQKQKIVGIIGLTFKPGTDDLRESPIVELVEILSGKGFKVKIFDDNVSLTKLIGGNKAFIEQVLPHISSMMSDSLEEVVQNSETIIVGHNLPDGGEQLQKLLKPDQLVIDLVKFAPNNIIPGKYEGVCW
jgi:GDP-mannose 6-dehydrogenase